MDYIFTFSKNKEEHINHQNCIISFVSKRSSFLATLLIQKVLRQIIWRSTSCLS